MAAFLHTGSAPASMPMTSFMGRDQELAAVTVLLDRPNLRLLTLTGPGGIGKSRLAQRVMDVVGDTYGDGVAFVPLGPVRDPELVMPTMAHVLGVPDSRGQPLNSRVQTFLARRHLLLVLDNAEQLLDPVASLVADLLGPCPRVTVLTTSRVRLGISGEQVFPVAALDPATARALFAMRAQAIDPAFTEAAGNAPLIDAICEKLDRLPLAIELAAARINVLPLPALSARLDRRLLLLTGGPRDAPNRQRDMRNTIAWSYELLAPTEQALFRQLGVFVGGFSLEAAEAVAGEHALDSVSGLVSSSLVNPTTGVGDEPRFTMLETIREYALEQLAVRGEGDAIRAALRQHVVDLAERHWVAPTGREEVYWLRRLVAEQGNIRAALAWALDRDPVAAARLASAVGLYWIMGSSVAEGRSWAERTLGAAPWLPEHIRARAQLTAGWMAKCQNDLVGAEAYLTEAVVDARLVGDQRVLCNACGLLGDVMLTNGDLARAANLLAESQAAAAVIDEPLTTAIALMGLGRMAADTGDQARAQAYLEDAVAAHRLSGGPLGVAIAQGYLGEVLLARGDEEGAVRHFRDALRGYADMAAWGNAGFMLEGIAAAAGSRHPGIAAHLLGGAAALLEQLDPAREPEHVTLHDRAADRARSELGDAAFAAAWAAGRQLTWKDVLAQVDALAAALGTPDGQAAADHSPAHGLTVRELEVLRLLAEGRSNRAIAVELSLSHRTIEHHVLHILTKLHAESRTTAAAWAVRHNLA